jgi:hypothetical protein
MKYSIFFIAFWSTTFVYAQQCRVAGQVFFADTVDHAITLATDSDDLVHFSYDGATSFVHAGDAHRVPPEQLNNGDRLCVGTSDPLVVTVTPRQEIKAEQKKELAAWQADSLYGVVSGVDRTARRITLAVSAGDQPKSYSVDVRPDAAYWFFPQNTARLSDAVKGSLDRLAPGDTLYVRGTGGTAQNFVASLVVWEVSAVSRQP